MLLIAANLRKEDSDFRGKRPALAWCTRSEQRSVGGPSRCAKLGLARSAAENLIQAIRAVIVGGLYVDAAIANLVFDASTKRAHWKKNVGNGLPLTDREGEVLRFVALAFTNKEIARKLNVGIKSKDPWAARVGETRA